MTKKENLSPRDIQEIAEAAIFLRQLSAFERQGHHTHWQRNLFDDLRQQAIKNIYNRLVMEYVDPLDMPF